MMSFLKTVMMTACLLTANQVLGQVYEVHAGFVKFHSDAPQELIRAESNALRGAVDVKKNTFAFRISIATFQGFNSPLQREHFNENYMETALFPEGSFSGKIIEDIDASQDGVYEVRAKGKLKIHGLEQERIIKAQIVTRDGKMVITSDFTVTLADHNIKIPRIVYDKLSPVINVSITATLLPPQ